MPKLRSLLPVFALLLFVVTAHPQETSVQGGKKAGTGVGNGTGYGSGFGSGSRTVVVEARSGLGAVGGVLGSYISPGINGIKGQPFSADVIDEDDQLLADGNHIHRESHSKLFRDSEGRTRTETALGIGRTVDGEPFVHITIFDPVQHQMIILEPRQKQAVVHTMGVVTGIGVTAPVRPGTPGSATAPSASSAQQAPPDAAALLESLRKIRQAQENGTTPPRVPSREDLGTSTLEGFAVTGTRISRTIPAGERGNDRPMITTTERWFSADLGLDLLSKTESPETGQHVHKLVNIHTGDPDPLLFQVPADYSVREQQRP